MIYNFFEFTWKMQNKLMNKSQMASNGKMKPHKLISVLTTIRGAFAGIGIMSFISLLISVGIMILSDYRLSIEGGFLVYCAIFAVAWSGLCCFCNTKIATLANSTAAVIVGFILTGKEFFWTFYISDLSWDENIQTIQELKVNAVAHGVTYEELFCSAINLIFIPLCFSFVVGTITLLFKSDWISEYNDGKDIPRNMSISSFRYK